MTKLDDATVSSKERLAATGIPPAVRPQLSLPLPGLIDPPPEGILIPRRDRVFTNRNLRMAKVGWIGFDMDYTLAIYRQEEMDALSVRLTVDRLIRRGYPSFLAELDFDTRFPIRGLLVDKEQGNILKMDRHKFVNKAYHGRRRMERAEIDALYHHKKVHKNGDRFHWIDTLFALCEATSFSAVVTALEDHKVAFDPKKLFVDIRTSIDEAHKDGAVYGPVVSNLPRFVERDLELPRALHKLRSAGKRLFLLTNSPFHYTDDVMSYLLGESEQYRDWRHYFDVIVCSSQKPNWFADGSPFRVRREDQPRTEPAQDKASGSLEKGQIYEGGSLRRFEKHLDLKNSRVLYVGDHIYGDILRSKRDSMWRTAFVIQELDQEIEALKETRQLRHQRRQLAEARPLLEDDLRFYSAKFKELEKRLIHIPSPAEEEDTRLGLTHAKEQIERLRGELNELETEYDELTESIDDLFHPYWGSLLKEMNGMSIFGQQVETYADIYMRRVSCLASYSPAQFYRSPHDLMSHEL